MIDLLRRLWTSASRTNALPKAYRVYQGNTPQSDLDTFSACVGYADTLALESADTSDLEVWQMDDITLYAIRYRGGMRYEVRRDK